LVNEFATNVPNGNPLTYRFRPARSNSTFKEINDTAQRMIALHLLQLQIAVVAQGQSKKPGNAGLCQSSWSKRADRPPTSKNNSSPYARKFGDQPQEYPCDAIRVVAGPYSSTRNSKTSLKLIFGIAT